MKDKYERTVFEITHFNKEDVIVTSQIEQDPYEDTILKPNRYLTSDYQIDVSTANSFFIEKIVGCLLCHESECEHDDFIFHLQKMS